MAEEKDGVGCRSEDCVEGSSYTYHETEDGDQHSQENVLPQVGNGPKEEVRLGLFNHLEENKGTLVEHH